MKVCYNFLLLVFVIIINSCSHTTEPFNPIDRIPYMSLNIGDLRQYHSEQENIYIQWEIIDTAYRRDGVKVFIAEESILVQSAILKAINYYFIKNEYFIQTEIDTIYSPTINMENPYLEQRLSKIYPNQDDYFLRTNGVADSEKVFFRVNFIDSLVTPAKSFQNVAQYEQIDSDSLNNISVYYAPEFGHIGALIRNKNGFSKVLLTYIKIGEVEVGEYIQFNSYSSRTLESNTVSEYCLFNYLFSNKTFTKN